MTLTVEDADRVAAISKAMGENGSTSEEDTLWLIQRLNTLNQTLHACLNQNRSLRGCLREIL